MDVALIVIASLVMAFVVGFLIGKLFGADKKNVAMIFGIVGAAILGAGWIILFVLKSMLPF